jgi:hypothetical protein
MPAIKGSERCLYLVARATKFCTVAPRMFGFPAWYFLRVTLLASEVLK